MIPGRSLGQDAPQQPGRESMNAPLAKERTTAKTHVLRSNPETIHWGYLDGGLEPVLTIDSGDRVIDRMRVGQSGMDAAEIDRIRDSARTQGHSSAREAGHRQSYPHRTDLRARRGDRRRARGEDPRYRAASELGLQSIPGLYGHASGGLPLLPAHSRCARQEEQHGRPALGAQGADAAVLRTARGGPAEGFRTAEQQGATRVWRQSRLQGAHRGQHDLSAGVERRRRCSRPATAMPPRATER